MVVRLRFDTRADKSGDRGDEVLEVVDSGDKEGPRRNNGA